MLRLDSVDTINNYHTLSGDFRVIMNQDTKYTIECPDTGEYFVVDLKGLSRWSYKWI